MYRLWGERELPTKYLPLLAGAAVYVGAASATPATPLAALPGAQAIIAGARIRYDGAFLDGVPTLRVISRTGIGFDNIVLADATARGVAVCNAPDAPTISTAEHAFTLLLTVAKQIKQIEAEVKRGEPKDFFSANTGLELYNRTLGLVGLGRIGRRVARMALALEMRVTAYDPLIPAEQAAALGVELAPTLDVLLAAADIVSLHLPLTPATRHLINAARLAQMKPGAILINAARGGLVEEAALLAALERGHLQGAGLDVFDREPPAPDHPLLQRLDVVATPHIAGATIAGKDRVWQVAIQQALQVLRGERPPHLLNPEVWPLFVQQAVLA